jgi:hypothetical protein
MKGKSGEELWQSEFFKITLQFLSDDIDEAEWELFFKEQKSKHHFELLLLKYDYSVYSHLIQKLSVKNRRRILFDFYSTGLTRSELEDVGRSLNIDIGSETDKHISLSEKKMTKFILMQNADPDGGSIRFLEIVALICRVPIHWLIEEEVTEYWENEYLLYLPCSDYTLERFYAYLDKINKYSRDVRGIKLHLSSFIFRLRVEVIFGAVLIELFHESLNEEEYNILIQAFDKLNVISGILPTVIHNRFHNGFFSVYRASQIICIPIEFQSNAANWQYKVK